MPQTHSNSLENHLPVFIQVVHSSEVPYPKKGACILESWSQCRDHSVYLWHIKQTWFNQYWKQWSKKPVQWKFNKAKWKSISYFSKPKVKQERATFSLSQWVVETLSSSWPVTVGPLPQDDSSSSGHHHFHPHLTVPAGFFLAISFVCVHSLYVIFFFFLNLKN